MHFTEVPPLYQIPASQAPPVQATSHHPPPPPTHLSGGADPVTFNPLSAGANRPAQNNISTRPSQTSPPPLAKPVGSGFNLWGGLSSGTSSQPIVHPVPQQQQQQQQPPLDMRTSSSSSGMIMEPSGGSSVWGGALAQQAEQLEIQRREAAVKQRATAYHVALNTALTARLSSALEAGASADMERQIQIQGELQARGATATREYTKLQQEREALDSAAHELQATADALDRWLKENEPKAQSVRAAVAGAIDPDEAIIPSDALSQQALIAQAADLAFEDTLGVLDKALEAKQVPLSEYLNKVRVVSRQQFIARAVSSKIANMQEAERKAAARIGGLNISGTTGAGAGTAATLNTNTTGAAAAAGRIGGGGNCVFSSVAYPPPVSAPAPATLPIGDIYHTSGGILLNPLAAAARNMRS